MNELMNRGRGLYDDCIAFLKFSERERERERERECVRETKLAEGDRQQQQTDTWS